MKPTSVHETNVNMSAYDLDGMLQGYIAVRLMYRMSDPFAFSMIFHDSDGLSEWCYARDLVASGIVSDKPHGHGDVKIWREDDDLYFILHNGDEGVKLRTPRYPVMQFVCKIYKAVPEGYEMNLIGDLDEQVKMIHE